MTKRLGLAVVAVALLSWLAGGLHRERLEARGVSVATKLPLTQSRLRQARGLLERAGRHYRDTRPELLEGQLLLVGGRRASAVRVLERIVDREPENAQAWSLLSSALTPTDPIGALRARRRAQALSPPVPG